MSPRRSCRTRPGYSSSFINRARRGRMPAGDGLPMPCITHLIADECVKMVGRAVCLAEDLE